MPAQQAAIYVRISKDREGLELGVERQEEDCRKIAERLGLPVYRVYKDNDLSGSKFARKARPQYLEMLEHARAGYFSTIIAYKSSRLTRRPLEHEGQIELAEHYGIRYEFVASPAFDLNTASGRLVARILAAQDAAVAEETSELIARKKLESAQQGQYLGGYRAYGYEGAQYDDEGNVTNRGRINIAIIQHEAEIYREVVQRIVARESIASIVHDLNDRDVPSPDGKQWQYGNTKRIITKQRYVIFDDADPEKRGTLEHHGQIYRATWPGLITRDTYERMMSRLREVSQKWNHGMSNGRKYLLTGFVFCGECGTPCYGSGKMRRDGSYQRRYRCRDRDNSGTKVGCGKVFRSADPLEDFVTEAVLAKLDTPEITNVLSGETSTDAAEQELLTKLGNQREHRKQLVIEYGQGLHSRQDYQLMLDAADDALALTQAELAKRRHDTAANILPKDQPVREAWEHANIDWRRAAAQLVVEKVLLKPGFLPGSMMYKQWRFNPNGIEIVYRELGSAELSAELCRLMSASKFVLAA